MLILGGRPRAPPHPPTCKVGLRPSTIWLFDKIPSKQPIDREARGRLKMWGGVGGREPPPRKWGGPGGRGCAPKNNFQFVYLVPNRIGRRFREKVVLAVQINKRARIMEHFFWRFSASWDLHNQLIGLLFGILEN